jgi:peptidoglycan glycosyltransferase
MLNLEQTNTRHRVQHLTAVLLAAFLMVGGGLIFWNILVGPAILTREDNPRLVEEELRIQRGRILSVNQLVLAETIGPVDDLRRFYPTANIGPAVGYYSFRHGTSGVEEGLDAVLRGDLDNFWASYFEHGLLHESQNGRDIRLTLNARWQRASETLLGEEKGAVLLLTMPDGAVRAMSSHPGYDPNLLDEQFDMLTADEDAPLLNRVTQGQYQPGRILQPLLLAYALNEGLVNLTLEVEEAERPVQVNGTELNCLYFLPEAATWAAAFQAQCPGMTAELGQLLGLSGLQSAFEAFGLLTAPQLPIQTETAVDVVIEDPMLAAIGQETLTVSPLQVALALTALGNGGQMVQPQLVQAVQNTAGEWQPQTVTEPDAEPAEALTPGAAQAIYDLLPIYNGISEFSTLVLSGPDGTQNGWYFGMAPSASPRYLVVVVVEEADNVFEAQRIGRSLLRTILLPDDGSG